MSMKDSVCRECARRMGYEPMNKVVMKARWYLDMEIARMENAARVDGARKLDV